MNRQTNASAKSKEVQRHPQANAQLHHICYCPNCTSTFRLLTATMLLLQTSFFKINAQTVQLQYSGNNQKIIEAVAEANRILNDPEFYRKVDSIKSFDNTLFSGKQILSEMNAVKTVEVTEYFKKLTRANARTQLQIQMNTAKLNRSLASITNTLIHESIHAVDWITNKRWDYTHRSQYEENPLFPHLG